MHHDRKGVPVIENYQYTNRFEHDLKKLSPEIREDVKKALKDLKINPRSNRLRLNRLADYHPPIYAIHATSNHSHKITMNINGATAVLRRVGTHKEIDRNP